MNLTLFSLIVLGILLVALWQTLKPRTHPSSPPQLPFWKLIWAFTNFEQFFISLHQVYQHVVLLKIPFIGKVYLLMGTEGSQIFHLTHGMDIAYNEVFRDFFSPRATR